MLNGHIALVTGATRHTGYGIAQVLLEQGAVVYVNGRKPADVTKAVAELGPKARSAPADLADERAVDAMMRAMLDEAGRIDILVTNACHLGIGPAFVEAPLALFDEVMAVNLRAAYQLSQLAAADMIPRRSGTIVHIGSNTFERAIRNRSAYIASKGAIDALTRAMAVELAPHGIRVNSVVPGYIHTSRWDSIGDATRDRRRANVPLGREADAADIGRAVAFLASEAAGNITGASLRIDGGVGAQLYPSDTESG